jgi:hypothetical protein
LIPNNTDKRVIEKRETILAAISEPSGCMEVGMLISKKERKER